MKRDKKLFGFVECMLHFYAVEFGLRLKKVRPLSLKKNFYGDCVKKTGRIRIQVRRRGVGKLLAYQIADTMAHELAHLKYMNHGERWFRFYTQVLHRIGRGSFYSQLQGRLK